MSVNKLRNEIVRGNLEFVKDFVTYDFVTHIDPCEYYSILHNAIKVEAKKYSKWYRQIVLHLIKSGRDVHFKLNGGTTLLVHALFCRSGYEVISELIRKGSDVNAESEEGYTPLFFALLMVRDKKIVYDLINNGARVNLHDSWGSIPLLSAVCNYKDPEIIKMLTKDGVGLNEHYDDGRNILMLDICKCIENSECLLKDFVDICIRKGVNVKDVDKNGNNIFHHTRCRYLVDLAISYGVCLEAKNYFGLTALMQAAVQIDISKLNYLLLCGAHVNCVDLDLNTPLHLIAESRKFIKDFCLNVVLYHGANIFACNAAGETPFDILCYTNHSIYSNFSICLIQRIHKYFLLFDENKFKIAEGIYKELIFGRSKTRAFNNFIADCRQELNIMKSIYIKDDLTFYEFCILKKFYKSKYVDISIDEYRYSAKEIRQLFPIYKDLIIMRIEDNMRKKSAQVLRKCFELLLIRSQPNLECHFYVELNYDCLHNVCRYLNRKEMYNLFYAAICDA